MHHSTEPNKAPLIGGEMVRLHKIGFTFKLCPVVQKSSTIPTTPKYHQ